MQPQGSRRWHLSKAYLAEGMPWWSLIGSRAALAITAASSSRPKGNRRSDLAKLIPVKATVLILLGSVELAKITPMIFEWNELLKKNQVQLGFASKPSKSDECIAVLRAFQLILRG